ncbi:hypothetical protein BU15DRAFT_75760 [Melanogaster broomeanus]|nr:hypothetical protein BU15DRAFT_75760 [Melanogaster broomeanus]
MSAAAHDQAAQVPTQGNQPHSTPIINKPSPYSTELPTAQDQDNLKLAEEMQNRFVGPMPVKEFFKNYLKPVETEPVVPSDPFRAVAEARNEAQMYEPFIQAIKPWIPGLKAVNTSVSAAPGDSVLKPDISFFEDSYVPKKSHADFSAMEMFVEFERHGDGAPFKDSHKRSETGQAASDQGSFESDTAKAKRIRGQMTAYAIAHHGHQFRHFSFSVLIIANHARFLRWDASAVVVTEQFDYQKDPKLIADFLWQFSQLPRADRGHDTTVSPAELPTDVEKRVRGGLDVAAVTPLFRYEVPRLQGNCYGPRPPYPSQSIVGRSTRTLPVWFIPFFPLQSIQQGPVESSTGQQTHMGVDRDWATERAIYLKDCWRFIPLTGDAEPEHEIYELLNSKDAPNIPKLVHGADVEGFTDFIHYRLVLGDVGRPLTSFKSTKELVGGVLGAMEAHWFAYDVLNLLHRDISPGNIILTSDGRGLLIDWELAKEAGEIGNRRHERTGTWQFMSAALLRQPGKLHILEDDIESFLHVLGWITKLQMLPMVDQRRRMRSVEGHILLQPLHSNVPQLPLLRLLETLSSPFKSRYVKKPPTDEVRAQVEGQRDSADAATERLSLEVSLYDQDMERLKTSDWFIGTLKNALREEGWPTDDEAVKTLVEPIDDQLSKAQQLERSGQMLSSQSQWEDSKGVASTLSLKREGSTSLTPEGPTKRFRDA